MKLYTYNEVVEDAKEKGLELPPLPPFAKNRLFLILFSRYKEQVTRMGGNVTDYHDTHMLPVPDVAPTLTSNYWIYRKPPGEDRLVLDAKFGPLGEAFYHVDKAWDPSNCEAVYLVMVRNKGIVHFTGEELYLPGPCSPTRIDR